MFFKEERRGRERVCGNKLTYLLCFLKKEEELRGRGEEREK
jgi:hypothetical protein